MLDCWRCFSIISVIESEKVPDKVGLLTWKGKGLHQFEVEGRDVEVAFAVLLDQVG